MEEAWTVVFRNLYTGFLLRDFAGKIVPGALMLFSIAAMYRDPRDILSELRRETPVYAVLLVAGFAWTVTLGTQSLAEGLGIWRYFPISSGASSSGHMSIKGLFVPPVDKDFDKDTLEIDEFQARASEDEKQQYERFVVIKEACGNLFVAGLLSLPAWMTGKWLRRYPVKAPRNAANIAKNRFRASMATIYILSIFVGLHRMHSQHVYRQMKFAEAIEEKHRVAPPAVVPESEKKH